MASYCGYHINDSSFSKPPLTLEKDRPVIDRLLIKSYDHNSFSDDFREEELIPFNNLLKMLSNYINKYNESFLGGINNKDSIADLEKQIAQLTLNGNTDSSYSFIKRKIDFKTTKINSLKIAHGKLTERRSDTNENIANTLGYFKGLKKKDYTRNRDQVIEDGVALIEEEINRQEKKVAALQSCLP